MVIVCYNKEKKIVHLKLYIVNGKLYMSSFYSHRLRKIPRLVHIHSLAHGNVIGKQLQRYRSY